MEIKVCLMLPMVVLLFVGLFVVGSCGSCENAVAVDTGPCGEEK